MNQKPKSPPWWQTVVLVGLMIALLWLERAIPLPSRGHQLVQIAIIGLVYALFIRWVQHNQATLRAEDEQRHHEAMQRAHEERWRTPPLNQRQQHFREVVHRATTQEKEK